MSNIIIKVEDLKKEFKIPKKAENLSLWKQKLSWFYREWEIKKAVEGVTFQIQEGEILGYLGPNGAGKSTTIKMLTGILHPTSGSIEVLKGLNPFKNRREYTQEIGVVFGQRSILAYDIPVKDSFRLFKAIYGLSEEFYQERLDMLVTMLGVDKFFETPYRMLSLGEKMRCELAASFIHQPKIVFLDEPTIGLDAQAKITIRKFLKEINRKENTTILITTHDMDDIEELCRRIIVIDEGIVAYEGSVKRFKEKYANTKQVDVSYTLVTNKEKLLQLDTKYGIENTIEKSKSYEFPLNESLGNFLKELVSCVEIQDLSIHEPKLENVIAEMYEKENKEKKKREKLRN
ncbi:MAG: ATP-binding cassette domain-containing protein [Nanoarchaeota archaeon]|nr:ATP-binding cassette domain-containing protein [Nanoarchaeota archaeon]